MRNIALLTLVVFVFAACNRKVDFSWNSSGSSSSDWTVDNKRTISRTQNGVTRKLEARTDVEIQNGQITKFPKGALVKLHESGGRQQREAELRENGGSLELWVKDKELFRRGSAEEETWLRDFLKTVTTK